MRKAPIIHNKGETQPSHGTISVTLGAVRAERDETARLHGELEGMGVPLTPPRTRGECPTSRPCPYVSCRYNLWQDPSIGGGIKYNFQGVEPTQMAHSCSLDLAENNPDGLTLEEVGRVMNLTRERVRQIEAAAIASLAKHYNIPEEQVASRLIKPLRSRK